MNGGCPASPATNYIIIGCVLGLLVIASIVYCVARKNAKKQAAPDAVSEVVKEEMRATLTEPELDAAYEKGSEHHDLRSTLLTRDTFFDSIRATEIHRESEITV